MTYQEACEWIALNKPHGWKIGDSDFRRDKEEAKRMSDPATWPKEKQPLQPASVPQWDADDDNDIVAELRKFATAYPSNIFTPGSNAPDAIAGTALRQIAGPWFIKAADYIDELRKVIEPASVPQPEQDAIGSILMAEIAESIVPQSAQAAPCPCINCREALEPGSSRRIMVLCPTCGSKRCPHATHHDNPCTGSNAPGQPGSIFGPAKQAVPSTVDRSQG